MEGRVLGDRYRIRHKLGEGGMASVWLADDLAEDRQVAVKVLSPGEAPTSEFTRRFRREFEACARLDHPNIIQLYSFGTIDEGGCYYAMEYVPAPTLERILERGGACSEDFVLEVAAQMAEAFGHYHARGVTHRDIKPSNVLVDHWGRVIITDFGLVHDDTRTQLTVTGTILGTSYYISPEILLGKTVDGRSDIYQLGVLLYELLSGRRPYKGRTISEIGERIVAGDRKPLGELRPSLSPWWGPVVATCLAQDPDERYQNAAALRAALSLRAPSTLPPSRAEAQATSRLPLVAALLLATLLLLMLMLGPLARHAYSVRDLSVVSGVDHFEVSWRSEEPYASQVALDGSPAPSYVGTIPGKVLEHHVLVSGLEAGREYTYRIVFPSGERSLPFQARVKRFRLDLLGLQTSEGGVNLLLRTDPPGPTRVTLRGTGGETLAEADSVASSELCSVAFVSFPEEVVSAVAQTQLSPGYRVRTDLGTLLEAQAHALCGQLAGFRPSPIVADAPAGNPAGALTRELKHSLAPRMVGQSKEAWEAEISRTKRERGEYKGRLRRRAASYFEQRLMASGYLEAYQAARSLSPLILGTRLLAPPLRERFHKALSPFVNLQVFIGLCEVRCSTLAPIPDRGEFGLSTEPLTGARHAFTLWPRDAGLLKLAVELPWRASGATSQWKGTFPIENLETVRGAELLFLNEQFGNLALRLRLNDRFETVVYDKPVLRKTLVPHSYVSQRLPLQYLREGENELTLAVAHLFDRFTKSVVKIEEMTLRLRHAE